MYPVYLVASNRPLYFKQVIDSLAPQIDHRPCFISIDWCGNRDLQEEQAIYATKMIDGAEIFIRKQHLGCGRHMIEARRFLFDDMGYNAGFILEDDLILAHHHLELSERLLHWAKSQYKNIGVVQLWNENLIEPREDLLNLVEETQRHWWAYLMTKDCWESISPILYEFENKFLKHISDYRVRDHRLILKWRSTVFKEIKYITNSFPQNIGERVRLLNAPVTGQDGITAMSCLYSGLSKVATFIGRGRYIGEWGVHKTPQIYSALNLDKFNNINIPNDHKIYEFRT